MKKTITPAALLRAAARAARSAYCPYSKYPVGAAVLTDRGQVYCGSNVENASFGLTICAERSAVAAAVTAGRRKIKAVAVVTAGREFPYPCGACRQVLAEFGAPDTPIYAAHLGHLRDFKTLLLGDLLPHAFRKKAD